MKKITSLSLCILLSISGFSQNIKVEKVEIQEHDDSVFITFTVVSDKLKSNERLTLTPVLYGGAESQALTPIILTGRNRQITDKRNSSVQGVRTKNNLHIPYTISVPYQHWMGDISLLINRKIESCCTERHLPSQTVVEEKPIRYDVIPPHIALVEAELSPIEQLDIETLFLTPMSEYSAIKENFDVMRTEGALKVRFRQGGSIIDESFEGNAEALRHVSRVLKMIGQDSTASVGKILLAGTASLEGTKKHNDLLAQKRIQSLQDYLKENVSLDMDQMESINLGEDWTGLRKIVEQSDMQYKTAVLEIIDQVPIIQGREKRLMDLKWGRPYNYMLEHFFPKLRNAGYIHIFYEKKSSVDLIYTNEAVQLYNKRQYHDALIKLTGVKPTAATEYLRGVCYLLLGELDKAEINLNRALELGHPDVVKSLAQLDKLRTIDNEMKKYNNK